MASIWDWSTTAINNATADMNWAEGMAPSAVNDSARAMMVRIAQLLDDLGAVNSVSGTANAIVLTPASPIAALATGLMLAFRATATNTGATTINVNGLGAKSVRKTTSSGEAAVSSGDIVSGGIYLLVYNTALNAAAGGWMLLNPSSATASAIGATIYTAADAAAVRTALSLGTAALIAIGTSSGQIPVLNGSGQWDAALLPATGVLTASYDSGEQTISAGGVLTLAHGLGAVPKVCQYILRCKTAEDGYTVGQEIDVVPEAGIDTNGSTRGFAALRDSTNITIRFNTNATNVINAMPSAGGAQGGFVNGNWRMIVRAYA